jgi:putative spermidine/putrescine transport system ATP-binding protein
VLAPTVLLVTHDPIEAARVADTVAVLDRGRVLQHGTPAHVHARPASLVVHRLLGGLTVVDGEVEDGAHASSLGCLPLPHDTGTGAGPGQLLLRHEAMRVVDPSDPAADVVGQVRERRGAGGRDLLVVACGPQLLHVEVATSESAHPGDVIGIVVPLAARHVVPGGPAGVPSRTPV